MKQGNIYDIQKLSIHDGDGIRTVVFMKGCPLRCQWCANPESQSINSEIMCVVDNCTGCGKCYDLCENSVTYFNRSGCHGCGRCVYVCPNRTRKLTGKNYTTDEVMRIIERDWNFYRRSGGGVTFSGGEPYMQTEFLLDLLKASKEIGINTAIETSSYTKYDNIKMTIPYVDQFFVDVKIMDSEVHKFYTNVGNELIIENLKKLSSEPLSLQRRNITVRVPLIAGINDSEDNISRLIELCSSYDSISKIELLCYHKLGVCKYKQLGRKYALDDAEAPDEETLDKISGMFEQLLDKNTAWKITR